MVRNRTALVTGVAGQDGIHLARLLLARGTRVVGTVRSDEPGMPARMVYLDGVHLEHHDLCDHASFAELLERHRPDEVYNLAGFSSVGASWNEPELVSMVNGTSVVRMLESLVAHRDRHAADVRFFQASSAEEFGGAASSPYARAKTTARDATAYFRDHYGLFACSGVLHNHESCLRPPHFVTRKITRAAAEIKLGRSDRLALGNLDISRDWGAVRDFVEAMILMLLLDDPTDLTIATGTLHSLRDLLETAFTAAGLDHPWQYVEQDRSLMRPNDTAVLSADMSVTERLLGWSATTSFEDLVAEMVDVDLRRVRSGVEESAEYLVADR